MVGAEGAALFVVDTTAPTRDGDDSGNSHVAQLWSYVANRCVYDVCNRCVIDTPDPMCLSTTGTTRLTLGGWWHPSAKA